MISKVFNKCQRIISNKIIQQQTVTEKHSIYLRNKILRLSMLNA